MRKFLILCVISIGGSLAPGSARAGSLIPDTGTVAMRQRALDLTANLHVLSLSLRPGEENLAAIAFFRLERGALVRNAFVTNGEAGEPVRADIPAPRLAGMRRLEAAAAGDRFDADAWFLNLPDIAAAQDTTDVRSAWQRDTLRVRLATLISSIRPDIIFVNRDAVLGPGSPARHVLLTELIDVIRALAPSKGKGREDFPASVRSWRVSEVWTETDGSNGVPVPIEKTHPLLRTSYVQLGTEAGQEYRTPMSTPYAAPSAMERRYALLFGKAKIARSALDAERGMCPPSLRSVERLVSDLGRRVLAANPRRRDILRRIPAIMDTASVRLGPPDLTNEESRALVNWSSGLEALRSALLGVTVKYSVSYATLTARQQTDLEISEVTGRSADGTTTLFVPGVRQGWILNASIPAEVQFSPPASFTLVTPERVDLNTPQGIYGVNRPSATVPLYIFVMHQAKNRERNFLYRIVVRISFAERLTPEFITPIVRAADGEKVIARLTNESRDPLRSWLQVRDSLVVSDTISFRLPGKGSTVQDTLTLRWLRTPPEGTALYRLTAEGYTVDHFAARSFAVTADTGRRVAVLTGREGTGVLDALRRIGMRHISVCRDTGSVIAALRGADVLLVDRRALALVPGGAALRDRAGAFAAGGGTVLVLAQDPMTWNDAGWSPAVRLERSTHYPEQIAVSIDSNASVAATPNRLGIKDFADWMFRRAYDTVTLSPGSRCSVPVRAGDGVPLIVAEPVGRGRIVYTALALEPQWHNIHPGSLRILANLIAGDRRVGGQ